MYTEHYISVQFLIAKRMKTQCMSLEKKGFTLV